MIVVKIGKIAYSLYRRANKTCHTKTSHRKLARAIVVDRFKLESSNWYFALRSNSIFAALARNFQTRKKV
jgi:hypothetical protein